jgi:hypothetical protein
MTYKVTIKNNYHLPIQYPVSASFQIIPAGKEMTFPAVASSYYSIPAVGDINLIDLGTRKLSSYDKAKYGVLLSFQGQECEYRYDKDGELTLTVTDLGQVEITAKGSLVLTDLPPFILKRHAHA